MPQPTTTGSLGAYCVELASGRVIYERRATHRVYPASTIKLAILIALAQAIDLGGLALDEEVAIRASWPSITGTSFAFHADDRDERLQARAGERITVGELAERMIVISSNEASNMLIDRIGLPQINAAIVATGAHDTALRHYFGDRAAWGSERANVTTAADLTRMVAAVAAATAAKPESCAWMLAILRRQQDVDLIPAALGAEVTVANKPGEADGVLHDLAVVSGAGFGRYAVAICSWGFADVDAAGAAVREQAVKIHRLVRGA